MSDRETLRDEIFAENRQEVHAQTDRLFAWILLAQWLFAILLALLVSPYGWAGKAKVLHIHLQVAIVLGGVLNALPWMLVRLRPGWWLTRHTIAVVQMLWSALLIHLTGGRIETHFHVFGSLAFLALYRDWRVLPTASLVLAADHLARGFLWPESVYGIANPEWWRFLEHAAWVGFEEVVLVLGCVRAVAEMKLNADREAGQRLVHVEVEQQVERRTQELTRANQSLAAEMKVRLQMEAELRQAQKLESVGRLAAGVAHEINTPVQFVSDSIHFLKEATSDLLGVVDKLQVVQRSVLDGIPAGDAAAEAAEAESLAGLSFLRENIPKAFDRSLDGLGRVTGIVTSMRDFAHPDSPHMRRIDLNRAVESTLTIARNEYKYVADVVTDLGDLPLVSCHAGAINQVILALLVNSAHAVSDVVKGTDAKGLISVRTRRDGDDVIISISDTGGGIPPAIRDRVFDPFFSTKEVGKGTGQGLAIARACVVEQHGGALSLESEVGKGTTFFVRLPIAGCDRDASGVAA